MRIAWDILITLPVVTESGQTLGRIVGGMLDTEAHALVSYEVKPSLLARHHLIISCEQVVTITSEHVVVKDATYPTTEQRKTNRPATNVRQAGAYGRAEEGV